MSIPTLIDRCTQNISLRPDTVDRSYAYEVRYSVTIVHGRFVLSPSFWKLSCTIVLKYVYCKSQAKLPYPVRRSDTFTVFQPWQNRRALRPSCPPWRPSCPPLRPSALPCALLAPLMPPIDFCSSVAVSGTTIY